MDPVGRNRCDGNLQLNLAYNSNLNLNQPSHDGNSLPMLRVLTSPAPLKRLSMSSRDRSQAHAGIKATPFLTKGVDAAGQLDRLVNGCRGASERTAFTPSGDFATGWAVRQPRRKSASVEAGRDELSSRRLRCGSHSNQGLAISAEQKCMLALLSVLKNKTLTGRKILRRVHKKCLWQPFPRKARRYMWNELYMLEVLKAMVKRGYLKCVHRVNKVKRMVGVGGQLVTVVEMDYLKSKFKVNPEFLKINC